MIRTRTPFRFACILALTAALAFSLAPASAPAAPLPDAALKQAREAEKAAAAGQPRLAVTAYEAIDAQFPGHSAVSLRLAQINDILDDRGPALFYYRRYLALAGGAAREESRVRAAALEMIPGVADAAGKIASARQEQSVPVPMATPTVQYSVAAITDDGTLRPLSGVQDLEKIARGEELPPPTPTPAAAVVLRGERLAMPSAPPPQASVAGGRPAVRQTPASAPVSSAPAPPAAGVSQDEDAALASAFARRSPGDSSPLVPAVSTPRTVIVLPDGRAPKPAPALPAQPTHASAAAPAAGAVTIPSAAAPASPAAPAGAALPVSAPSSGGLVIEYAAPSLSALDQAAAPPVDARPPEASQAAPLRPSPAVQSSSPDVRRGFFENQRIGGRSARLKLSNHVPDSMLTFVAIPEGGGQAVNAVIATGEARTFELLPGMYEVVATAVTNTYPPSPLLERRFSHHFQAGNQYTRRLTPETLQTLD